MQVPSEEDTWDSLGRELPVALPLGLGAVGAESRPSRRKESTRFVQHVRDYDVDATRLSRDPSRC